MFNNLWMYRDFIFGSVKRDFQLKFRNSILGIFWVFLNPLGMILVYTVIFSQLMKAKLPLAMGSYSYSIYLCVGILCWGLFAEIFSRSITLFLDNANVLKKIKLPKICLPMILILNAWINFVIVFTIFLIFLIVTNNFPGKIIFFLIPIILILTILAISLGVGLGILNVFYRDIEQMSGTFLQFWFWLTPIVYSMDILPSKIQFILQLNPVLPLMVALQSIVVFRQQPAWESLVYPIALTLILCGWTLHLMRRHQNDMVDEL